MEVDTEMNGIEHAISQINIDQGDLTAMERERDQTPPNGVGCLLSTRNSYFQGCSFTGHPL